MEKWKIFVIYLAFFGATALFSFLINGLFLRFSRNLGVRNFDDTIIRWGTTAKPSLGGISFYIVFLISLVAYGIFFSQSSILLNLPFLGFLAGVTVAFLMGLADDAYNTRPFLKFLAQLCCGAILVATGTSIHFFEIPQIDNALTILWVIGMMNSINMLDNMDGITSVVSLSVILSAILVLIHHHDIQNIDLLVLVGVAAGLLGFLYYNWNPSKIYMGDTGSQFLGFFLAAIGIKYFWNTEQGVHMPSRQFVSVLIVFILPIVDTTTVVVNRLSAGKSPFVGGKDHTTHNLSYLGYSDKQVAIIFSLLSALSIAITYFIYNTIERWSHLYTALFLLYFLVVAGTLFGITRYNAKKKELRK